MLRYGTRRLLSTLPPPPLSSAVLSPPPTKQVVVGGGKSNNSSTSKLIALGLGGLVLSLALGVGIYLPYYSQSARRGEGARRNLHSTRGDIGAAPLVTLGDKLREDKAKTAS